MHVCSIHALGPVPNQNHWSNDNTQVDYVNPTTPAPPVVTAKVVTGAPVTTSGIKIGAPMDLTGLYAVPVKITNTTRTQVRRCCVGRDILPADLSAHAMACCIGRRAALHSLLGSSCSAPSCLVATQITSASQPAAAATILFTSV
jgi:hypothetical protein